MTLKDYKQIYLKEGLQKVHETHKNMGDLITCELDTLEQIKTILTYKGGGK